MTPNPLMNANWDDEGYFLAASTCTQLDTGASLCPRMYSFGPVPLTMTNGEATGINGAITGENGSVEVAAALSQFAALRSLANPDYQSPEDYFYAQAIPQGSAYGYLIQSPILLEYFSGDNDSRTDYRVVARRFHGRYG